MLQHYREKWDPFDFENIGKRVIKSPKIYFYDAAGTGGGDFLVCLRSFESYVEDDRRFPTGGSAADLNLVVGDGLDFKADIMSSRQEVVV